MLSEKSKINSCWLHPDSAGSWEILISVFTANYPPLIHTVNERRPPVALTLPCADQLEWQQGSQRVRTPHASCHVLCCAVRKWLCRWLRSGSKRILDPFPGFAARKNSAAASTAAGSFPTRPFLLLPLDLWGWVAGGCAHPPGPPV